MAAPPGVSLVKTDVAGFPAIVDASQRAETCLVILDVADGRTLHVSASYTLLPRMAPEQLCAKATTFAGAALTTLTRVALTARPSEIGVPARPGGRTGRGS